MAIDLKKIDPALLSARPAKEGGNILTPIARMSFPTLYEARSQNKDGSGKKKFSVNLLIPPECNIDLLKKAAKDAAFGKWGEKAKDLKLKNPFLDAAEQKREGYLPGWVLVRPSSEQRPTVVTVVGGSITKLKEFDAEEVYAGRWCTASLNAFAYDTNGNKGVSFGLNNIMLLNHDEALAGRAKAEDEFEAVGGSEDATTDSIF